VKLLTDIRAQRGVTLICVVHDLDLLPRLADRAIALRHGTVVADLPVTAATPSQLRGMLQ
jgi:ABC-type phosphate/phosphonate transport system ATPase subunit